LVGRFLPKARSRRWRQLAVGGLAAVVGAACVPRPAGHDLRVTNAWITDLTIQISAQPLAPQDQRTTLGAVRVGQTTTFAGALPEQEQYVIHARYDGNRLEFDTVCLTARSLADRGWSVTVPGTASTCQPY
jgi:hypothetical protein